MKYWFVFILLLQLLLCSNLNRPIEKNNNTPAENIESDTCVFNFKNDTICQNIRIVFLKENQIIYDYHINNSKRKLSINIKGYATKKRTENMELGEDEYGNAYSVDEYENRNGNCWIIIAIDNDKKDKLTIMSTSECSAGDQIYTPFSSVGVMRKLK